jgi:hypothetical protein
MFGGGLLSKITAGLGSAISEAGPTNGTQKYVHSALMFFVPVSPGDTCTMRPQ